MGPSMGRTNGCVERGGGVGEGVIWHNLFDRPIFHSFGFTACILYLLFFGMR